PFPGSCRAWHSRASTSLERSIFSESETRLWMSLYRSEFYSCKPVPQHVKPQQVSRAEVPPRRRAVRRWASRSRSRRSHDCGLLSVCGSEHLDPRNAIYPNVPGAPDLARTENISELRSGLFCCCCNRHRLEAVRLRSERHRARACRQREYQMRALGLSDYPKP